MREFFSEFFSKFFEGVGMGLGLFTIYAVVKLTVGVPTITFTLQP